VVSDNTRPVPYSGPDGILKPIVDTLKENGVGQIKIIIATGTHRPMGEAELRRMLGESAFQAGVQVINHVGTDSSMLRSIGQTERTPDVSVNSHYLDAELKIATGLVEPHYMAGFSGGRKAICPGICGQSVTYGFHSAPILNEKNTASLVLEGNPCHEEALRIAKMAGVDFSVNVTINKNKRLAGVFSGELEKAHIAAVEHIRRFVCIELARLYDVVITQADEVGVNHYQSLKAAFEAGRAVKPGGRIVLLAKLTDPDPIGTEYYKRMLSLLVRLGAEELCKRLLSDDWEFEPEQWQVQMWSKVFQRIGEPKNLYNCAVRLAEPASELIAETNAAAEVKRIAGEDEPAYAERMVQTTIDKILASYPDNSVLVLPDGPYSIPVLV
jgi:nickel-dependent lactate racemase